MCVRTLDRDGKMAKQSNPGAYSLALRRLGKGRIIAIMGIAAVAAAFTGALAFAGIARSVNPALALKFVPSESLALASLAEQLLASQPREPRPDVKRLAMASLRQQSLNPKALRVLGYVATAEMQEKRARSLIQLAESQSRRDSGAQLWLIEDAVQRDALKQVLSHYDTVLRTHPSIYTTLFPILTQGISDPDIRTALIPYIKTDGSWAPQLIVHAIANSSDLPALVDLLVRSGGVRNAEEGKAENLLLLQRLTTEQQFADAQRLYLGVRGNTNARLVSASFYPSDVAGSSDPMEWQTRSGSDAGAGFVETGGARPALSIFANAATVATVATKLLYLRPGNYDFAAKLSKFEAGDGAQIRWQLRCPSLSTEQPAWSLVAADRAVTGALSISQECAVQYLDIVVSGGSGANGADITIDSISLLPAGR